MISCGKKARIQAFGSKGGPRALLLAKHPGAYINRPAEMGGRTRQQKMAARRASAKAAE